MALRRNKSSKKGRTISADFSDVGEGGGGFKIPEGEYGVRCEEAKQEVSSNDNEMISFVFIGTEGKAKGKKFFYHNTLVEQSLWKLKETLIGLGVEVPDSVMDIDLDELEGLEGTAIVEDDTYQGKTRSKIVGFVQEAGEEEEETKPKRSARGNGKAAKFSEEEVLEMGEEELESLIGKSKIEVDLSDFKTLSKKRAAVIASLDEAKLLVA